MAVKRLYRFQRSGADWLRRRGEGALLADEMGLGGDQFATVVWAPNWEDDLHGFNFYIATNAGGPFSKVNGTVINAALSPEWTQGGLANGQTYYIKVTAVDFSGNESAQSASVNVTPMP